VGGGHGQGQGQPVEVGGYGPAIGIGHWEVGGGVGSGPPVHGYPTVGSIQCGAGLGTAASGLKL